MLYDYDAADDNELTLREGDVLTNVDQVDEGWWSATDAQGNVGLFPANYVELIEASEASEAPPAPPAPPPSTPPWTSSSPAGAA